MKDFRIAMFADADVGLEAVEYIINEYGEHLCCVVVCDSDEFVSKQLKEKKLISSDKILSYSWIKKDEGLDYLIKQDLDHISYHGGHILFQPRSLVFQRKESLIFIRDIFPILLGNIQIFGI